MSNNALWADVQAIEKTASDQCAALIGTIIRLRKEQGISQMTLSELSDVSQKTIARIEAGTEYPRLDTLAKLLYALDRTIAIVDSAPA